MPSINRSLTFALKYSLVFSGYILGNIDSCQAAVSLPQALLSAYQNNPHYHAEEARTEAQRAQRIKAVAQFLPSVSLIGSKESDTSKYTNLPGRTESTYQPQNGTLELRQSVFNGFRDLAGFKQAVETIRATESRLTSTQQKLLFDTVQAYLEVWAGRENLRVSLNGEKTYQQQLKATESKYTAGTESLLEVERAKSKLYEAQARVTQAKAALSGAIATFTQLTGLPGEEVEFPTKLKETPTNLDGVIQQAQQENPALIQAQHAYEAASAAFTSSKGNFLPRVDVIANVNQQKYAPNSNSFAGQGQPPTLDSINRSVKAVLTVPLFQQGVEYAELKEKRNQENAARLDIRAQQQEIIQASTQAWANLQGAKERVVQTQENIKAAEFLAEGLRKEHMLGTKSLFDVIVGEDQLLQAQYSHIQAIKEELTTHYQILSLIGTLTVEKISALKKVEEKEKQGSQQSS